MSLAQIETLTKQYADTRDALNTIVRDLEAELEAVKDVYRKEIKRAVEKAQSKHTELQAAVEAAPQLFNKPRTYTFHGVKVGYQKQKGGLVFENPEQTIKLIKKLLPDQTSALIITKESAAKTALANLDGATLKKLGVSIQADTDVVVIKTTDSDIDKLVDALFKDDAKQAA